MVGIIDWKIIGEVNVVETKLKKISSNTLLRLRGNGTVKHHVATPSRQKVEFL